MMKSKRVLQGIVAGCSVAVGVFFGATLIVLLRLQTMDNTREAKAPPPAGKGTPLAESPAAEDLEDFHETLAVIQAKPSGRERENLMSDLIDRWLVEAPEEAFNAIVRLPGSTDQRIPLLERLVSEWAKIDARATFDTLRAAGNSIPRGHLQAAALRGLAKRDAAAALRWMESVPELSRPEGFGEIFYEWTKQDLEGAKRKVARLENPKVQREAVRVVAEALVMKNPSEALEWAESLDRGLVKWTATAQVLAALARQDPEAALQGVERIADDYRKAEATQMVLERWGEQDPAAALNWARDNVSGELRRRVGVSLIPRLAEDNPSAALSFLDDSLPGHLHIRHNILRTSITMATLSNPESAATAVEALSEGDRAEAVFTLVNAWDPFDGAGLADSVSRLGSEDLSQHAGSIATNWAQADPQAALHWAESLPGTEREEAFGAVVGRWAEWDPGGAAEYVAAMADATFQQGAAAKVVTEWARWEPAEAAAWVQAALEDPEVRGTSYRTLATIWLEANPHDASAWIDTLPQGSERDAAVIVLLETLATPDPETAAVWAETLSDPGTRESWREKLEGQ